MSGKIELKSLEVMRQVLRHEAEAILALAERLDESFERAVRMILECPGRVVTCGLGKSGHIARKAAGTLSSTGTPSHFLHAAEAAHGDLGTVHADDVVVMYTYSGESDDLMRLFPSVRAIGAKVIAMTGRPESSVGRAADLVLDCSAEGEACPNNLAPTTSTTLMLAASDALALAVMDARGFTAEEFARFHPAGALGKRLLLKVSDVMRVGDDLALAPPDMPVLDVMQVITRAGAGVACIVDANGYLLGLIADGDLRRHFVRATNPLASRASEIMINDPVTIEPQLLAVEALEIFQNLPKKIGEIPVLENRRVVGLLMLKDLLRSGIV
jgi:arabinose-5-phosphate isomerase